MQKNLLLINCLAFFLIIPTPSYGAQQEHNQLKIIQKVLLNTYNSAAPIVYDTSVQLLSTSRQFIQNTLFNQSHNAIKQNKSTGCASEEFEEITPNINYEQLIKMSENGSLKKILENSPATAINHINNITSEHFKTKNLEQQKVQEKIFQTFSIAHQLSQQTNTELELAKALAIQYSQLQNPILTNLTTDHAINKEPALNQQRAQSIQQAQEKCKKTIEQANLLCEKETNYAKQKYNQEIENHRKFAAQVAFNRHYLHQKSGKTDNNINLDDYATTEKYLTLLTTIQQQNSSNT